ncbi:2-oxoglutarate/2-oxoacid ferredoxin oxidoreductase, gamma subunit / 2-oxoglutarate/2-oxoacid ferredoxin oxidoreductase, alpha subunit, partial [hydrothermal vent metagenome]
TEEWMAPPIDQSPWPEGLAAYEWDEKTGLSRRPIPGQRGGEYVLTGLAHTKQSHVAYDPTVNQMSCEMRSRKMAALAETLTPPTIHGDEEGDLLIVGWGSTIGSIEEAVDRARGDGHKVSSVHLRFIAPMEPGLKEMFDRFKRVMTVELNYSDPQEGFFGNPENARRAQLAQHLRAQTLHDVGYWSITPGQPLQPAQICQVILNTLAEMGLAERGAEVAHA